MLQKLKLQDFDKVYALLKSSFPFDERRSYHDEKRMLGDPRHTVYVVYGPTNEVQAFLTAWDLHEFVFVENFAVSSHLRNRGLGGEMMEELKRRSYKRIALEVEPPETETARRRIGFYERHGFFLNDYAYMLPSLGEGKKSIPLQLMTTGTPLDEAGFEALRADIYKYAYKVREESST